MTGKKVRADEVRYSKELFGCDVLNMFLAMVDSFHCIARFPHNLTSET